MTSCAGPLVKTKLIDTLNCSKGKTVKERKGVMEMEMEGEGEPIYELVEIIKTLIVKRELFNTRKTSDTYIN